MKRLLLPLLAAFALPTAVNANVNPEVHKLCKDVSDYVGCVEANKNKNSFKIKNIFSRKSTKESNKIFKNKFFTANDRIKVEKWKKENFDPSKQPSVGYIYAWADDDSGIYAIKVFSSGAASRAGLKESSLITHIDNQRLSEADAETVRKLYLGGKKLTGTYKGKNFTKRLKDFLILKKKGMEEFDYYIAQNLRLESGLDGDIDFIVLPEIKENIRKNLSDHYSEKRSERKDSNRKAAERRDYFLELTRTRYIIKKPCEKDWNQSQCYYYQRAKELINGTAISYCGVSNGSLAKDDFWPFAIEYTTDQFTGQTAQLRNYLVEKIYSSRFAIQKSAKNLIKKAGGCAYLLKDNYPSLYRENKGNDGNAPSLQETMQDTPFEW